MTRQKVILTGVAMIAIAWFANRSDPSSNRTSTPPAANVCETTECTLAMLETGHAVSATEPTTLRMRMHLAALSAEYPERPQQIADMTVRLQQILHEEGHAESLESLFDGLQSLPHPQPKVPAYSEAAAVYATLRQRGFSHDSAIVGMSSMLRSLGRLQ